MVHDTVDLTPQRLASEGATREVLALRTLHALITTVNSFQDLGAVLQAVAQGVVDTLGFQVAVINYLTPRDDFEVVAVAGIEDARRTLMSTRNDREPFLEELARAEEWGSLRFMAAGTDLDEEAVHWVSDTPPLDLPDAWHPGDSLYAPLHGPTGELVGILGVDLPEDGRRPGPLRREVLEMYAVQAGLAIHHARERGRLEERLRLGAVIRSVMETAASELDLDQILEGSVAPLIAGFRCRRAWIGIFADPHAPDPEAGAVSYPADLLDVLGHASASEQGPVDVGLVLRATELIVRSCWEEGRTVVVSEHADNSPGLIGERGRSRVLRWLETIGDDQLVLVPLGAGRRCLGYVVLTRSDGAGDWTTAEAEAALEVGRELGRVVGHAVVYAREQQLVHGLRELDARKSELITTITHELKNPLTSIRGHLELLDDEHGAPVPGLRSIRRNTNRLLHLIDDMLVLTRVKDSRLLSRAVPVDLSTLVLQAVELQAIHATHGNVAIDVSRVEEGVDVLGDREELERMVVNLVSNAVKYSEAGGSVRLLLRQDTGRVVFSCTDDGLGITAHDQLSLFDEFDRSSNPRARARAGTGLGLSIVQRVVERHHGTIELQSELGRGSTFTVSLPVRRPGS